MKGWEKRLLKYCMQEGLLTPQQVTKLSGYRRKHPGAEQNILLLISNQLGWEPDLRREYLARACPPQQRMDYALLFILDKKGKNIAYVSCDLLIKEIIKSTGESRPTLSKFLKGLCQKLREKQKLSYLEFERLNTVLEIYDQLVAAQQRSGADSSEMRTQRRSGIGPATRVRNRDLARLADTTFKPRSASSGNQRSRAPSRRRVIAHERHSQRAARSPASEEAVQRRTAEQIIADKCQQLREQLIVEEAQKATDWDISESFAAEISKMQEVVEVEQAKEEQAKQAAALKAAAVLVNHNIPDGQRVGSYILTEKIGAGGMGVIYKSYHPGLDQYFAVKTLHSGDRVGAEQVERFIREARIAARLKHTNIVAIHDIGKQGKQYYIAMDYIEGEDLGHLLAERRLPVRQTLEIIRQIADALAMAHRCGVIHRDIKPSNILIARQEQRPYLMDFGLAAIREGDTDITKTGQFMGTPLYMSPEQARGKIRELDHRSDIYSLGAVLYEMLSGQAPAQGENVAQVILQITRHEPVPLAQLCPQLPSAVNLITMKCLAKEPRARYQHMEELVRDIEAYLRGEQVALSPPSAQVPVESHVVEPHVAPTAAQSNKLPWLVAVVVVLLLLGSNAWLGWELIAQKQNDAHALDSPHQPSPGQESPTVLNQHLQATLQEYNHDIHLEPQIAQTYSQRGDLYRALGRSEQAIEDYSRAIALRPDDPRNYYKRARLYTLDHNWHQAIQDYTRIIKMAPGAARAYNYRGQLLAQQHQSQKALQDFNKAISLRSNYWHAYFNRGQLYYRMGKYEQARADLQRCREAGIKDPRLGRWLRVIAAKERRH